MLYKTMLLVWARVQNWPHLEPSLAIMTGIEMRNERIVVRANWLPMLPRRSEKNDTHWVSKGAGMQAIGLGARMAL